jgi:hypothetical protein
MRILAVIVLVVGLLGVWGGFSQPDTPSDDCPVVRETQDWTFSLEAWPPLTVRCDVTRGNGDVVASTEFIPWRDYLTVLLVAFAVAVFRPLSPLRWLASLALLLAAGVAFFF